MARPVHHVELVAEAVLVRRGNEDEGGPPLRLDFARPQPGGGGGGVEHPAQGQGPGTSPASPDEVAFLHLGHLGTGRPGPRPAGLQGRRFLFHHAGHGALGARGHGAFAGEAGVHEGLAVGAVGLVARAQWRVEAGPPRPDRTRPTTEGSGAQAGDSASGPSASGPSAGGPSAGGPSAGGPSAGGLGARGRRAGGGRRGAEPGQGQSGHGGHRQHDAVGLMAHYYMVTEMGPASTIAGPRGR